MRAHEQPASLDTALLLLRQAGPRAFNVSTISVGVAGTWAPLAHLRPPLAPLGSGCLVLASVRAQRSAAHTTANGHLLAALVSLLLRGDSYTTSVRIVRKQRRNLRL